MNLGLLACSLSIMGIGICHADVSQLKVDPDTGGQSKSDFSTSPHREADLPVQRDKYFRCWQNGQLILVEHGWIPVKTTQSGSLKKDKNNLHIYDYGETFCVYFGK